MRDRLIELLKSAGKEVGKIFKSEAEYCLKKGELPQHKRTIREIEADCLLADGVFVPLCKVGDTVYVEYYGKIVNAYVTGFEINSRGPLVKVYIDPDTDMEYDEEDVFFTKEEAEVALKGGAE